MKVQDTIPFAHELIGPLHQESFRREGARPGPSDAEIDDTWYVAREGDDPITLAAEDHLVGFLDRSLGVSLGQARSLPIRLHVDPALGGEAETHRLQVADDGIDITGAAPSGVLQGVFHLESLMRERGGPYAPRGEILRRPLFRHRIHRSALSPFYVEELTGFRGAPFDIDSWGLGVDYAAWTEEDAGPNTYYHDNHLVRMREHGINAIWLRGALREFARTRAFPEFGERSDAILDVLRGLVHRAARYDMKVFLYLNEPMGLPAGHSFWEAHPHLRGVLTRHAPIYTICTSEPEVRGYLSEASRYVFAKVPELAGAVLISASEYPSHCYCHQARPDDPAEAERLISEGWLCAKCASRPPQEVVAEVITLIRDGVKAASPDAEVIAWNWSWSFYEPDPQMGILERLPRDVILMGDFERGEPTRALDFDYENDEYSIKVVGPSRRFRGVAEFQRGRDMPIYARVQIGTTHENPNVPYLPALQKIARKYLALHDHGITGMMTCWNFGNMLSLATEVANEFSWDPRPTDIDEGLLRVATRHFGPEAAGDVVAAWRIMSEAQDDFPGSIPVMYHGPISRGPAFGFEFDPIGREFPNSWLLDRDPRGDILGAWTAPFGPELAARCYRAVAERWADGVDLMERALARTQGDDRRRLERESGVARMCLTQLLSSANLMDFLMARDAFLAAEGREEQLRLLGRLEALCHAERDNASAALRLCDADPRLGWHGEAYGYMIDRPLIERKIAGLEQILAQRIPQERRRREQGFGGEQAN